MDHAFGTEATPGARLIQSYQPLFVRNQRAIRESWARCRSAGLSRDAVPRARRVSAARLAAIYESAADVRALALAELRLLHGHLGAYGFSLTLADADSVILDCLPGAKSTARDTAALAPGTCWPEATRGTNAVGTAAALGRIVVVSGTDHYLTTYDGLVCVATPIFGADGEIRAIIDATSRQPIESHTLAYTLGLMQMAGGHVQTELFRRRHADAHIVLLDAAETAAMAPAAALAFEADGRLRAMSAGARALFAAHRTVRGTAFATLFDTSFNALIAAVRPPVGFTPLIDDRGRAFQATVYLPYASGGPIADHAQTTSCMRSLASGYIAEDTAVRNALALAGRATGYGVPILIHGETGSGKEHVARHIHAASGRAGAFVAVNCAGLPADLIEAELFGHVAGAFTGARAGGADGLVRQADGGTLFLDEIGDMPAALQVHLLRLLDDWRVRPVGGDAEIPVDVQLVAATHHDLDAAVTTGAFRADLLHRIRVAEVDLPPLRARTDHAILAETLLAAIDPDYRLDPDALDVLIAHDWPGNIRQLRNVLTRAILSSPTPTIDGHTIRTLLAAHEHRAVVRTPTPRTRGLSDADVKAAVHAEDGNIAAAARWLGVSRTTIYKHLKP